MKISTRKKFENVRLEHGVQVEMGAEIGRYSYVCSGSKIFRNVKIGNFCSIANNVIIGASVHPLNYLSTHPFQYEPGFFTNRNVGGFENFPQTLIGHDVWIGSNSVIKCGVKIGNGAVIGSGAIVVKDVPDYAVVVGVPAKIKKMRFSPEIVDALEKTAWWNLSEDELKNLPFENVRECILLLKTKAKNK